MERSEILELMSQLQLAGMREAYDEIVTAGVKRNLERLARAALAKAPVLRRAIADVRSRAEKSG